MKKLFFAIMLLSNLVFAGICDSWSYANHVTSSFPPIKSGKYYAISSDNTYSDGSRIKNEDYFLYTAWKDDIWYNTHWISCSVNNIEYKAERETRYFQSVGSVEYTTKSCYLLTLNCTVSERTQFYAADVKYTDLKGYRKDGTLKWTRDEIGSTDIYCYNNTGMTIIKHVNDPQYCKQ